MPLLREAKTKTSRGTTKRLYTLAHVRVKRLRLTRSDIRLCAPVCHPEPVEGR